jgi:hypothetical protein
VSLTAKEGACFCAETHTQLFVCSVRSNHSIDETSAEFNGGDFTHTWIYGTQAGEVSFWESMITVEYFLQLKDATGPFVDANSGNVTHDGTIAKMTKEINGIPPKAPVAGYYPTKYTVEYDSSTATFRAALTDLEWLELSDGEDLTQLCEPPSACPAPAPAPA